MLDKDDSAKQICKHWTFLYVATFCLLGLNFLFYSYAALMLCLGLGTKKKHLVKFRKASWFGLKYPFRVAELMDGDGPTCCET